MRGPKRELISRAYNLLLKVCLRGRFTDAQCGFKALRREAALQLLPLVEDDEWFFDTELLVTAERLGLRMSEVPVDWVDDPDSRVNIVPTAVNDLRGVWRLLVTAARGARRRPSDQVAADQLLRFAGVGLVSTVGYLFLFIAWRPLLGPFGANAVALAICTIFNLAVHRELARSLRRAGPPGALRRRGRRPLRAQPVPDHPGAGGGAGPGRALLGLDLLAVTVANAVAAVLRFAVLRAWVFRPTPSRPTTLRRQPRDHAHPPDPRRRGRGARTPVAGRRHRPEGATAPPRRRRGAVTSSASCGAGRGPGLGPARPAHPVDPDRGALPVGPRRLGLGQFLLLGRGAGGDQELEGLLLRLVGLLELHHGGQAAGVAVGHGTLGPDLRVQLLEHAGTASPGGGGHRRVGLPDRPALVLGHAALLAGAVVALTPVAAMMFRFNNPDALLALLLTGAMYATVRALERAQTWWLVLAGTLVGFGFLTKMMQAFLILPALGIVYLIAAPTRGGAGSGRSSCWASHRGGGRMVGGGGALTPAADRPYVGGSQDNSILNLIFGYNGFGRLTGTEAGHVGGTGSRAACGAPPVSPVCSTPPSAT